MRAIRSDAKAKEQDQLVSIQSGKGSKAQKSESFNASSTLVESTFYGEEGEQIWIGIRPGTTVRMLEPLLSKQELFNFQKLII